MWLYCYILYSNTLHSAATAVACPLILYLNPTYSTSFPIKEIIPLETVLYNWLRNQNDNLLHIQQLAIYSYVCKHNYYYIPQIQQIPNRWCALWSLILYNTNQRLISIQTIPYLWKWKWKLYFPQLYMFTCYQPHFHQLCVYMWFVLLDRARNGLDISKV